MSTLLGHTLGTPNHTLAEAMELFAASGLDGAEVIWQDDYRAAIPETDEGGAVFAAKAKADELGLRIGCLTPYVTQLNCLDNDVRRRDIRRLHASVIVAERLQCPRIRVYGGTFLPSVLEADAVSMWGHLVESLRELGRVATDHGVVLCVENHFNTMTVTAADTVRLVSDVGLPGVGILYDQANLTFTHSEAFEEAIALQADWIRHVHVKDLVFTDPNRRLETAAVANIAEEDRIHRSRMIGDGVLDWGAIIARLSAVGYDGSYSLEYEYRWNPQDLPDPAIGIPESARRLRRLMVAAGTVPSRPA